MSFLHTLRDEVLLKLAEELEIEEIIWCQGFLPDDSLHGLDIFTDGIVSILQGNKIQTNSFNKEMK